MSNGTVACPQVFPQFNTQAAKPLPMLYALTSEGKSRELLKLAAQFAVKRILDYIVAGLGARLLSPLMLGIALLIRLDSRGPVLFRQQRLGLGGKPFRLWKFRTMVVDAEDRLGGLEHLNESRGGVLFKIRHDPRVTRIGRLLRRTSLDELPQLFNLLQGHMSLVGPRPLPLRDCERLQEIDRQQFQGRHSILPGLTGPWQVRGRSETGIEHMINLDLEYIDTWSLWRDLRLIGRTIIVVLSCRVPADPAPPGVAMYPGAKPSRNGQFPAGGSLRLFEEVCHECGSDYRLRRLDRLGGLSILRGPGVEGGWHR